MKTKLLAVLAGILYCSWPLGPWLNPVAASHKLASQLGGLHQPYNWVFIGGDVACGLLSMLLAYMLWRHARASQRGWQLAIVIGGIAVFGLCTALAAGVPVRCETALQSCPSPLHDPQLLVHGITSVLSSVALGVSLLALWAMNLADAVAASMFVIYSFSGVVSLSEIVRPTESNSLQHLFLVTTSICLLSLPYIYQRALRPVKKV